MCCRGRIGLESSDLTAAPSVPPNGDSYLSGVLLCIPTRVIGVMEAMAPELDALRQDLAIAPGGGLTV